jgi:uncharacterized cupin superfamily protein
MSEPPTQAGDGVGAVEAAAVEPRAKVTTYPPIFAERVTGRKKRILGELFGLKNFGVNLTLLAPGASSSLHHRHSRQDEFVYIVKGEPILVTDTGEIELRPGMCAGFPAGGQAHHLENRTEWDVLFLEVGDRTGGDEIDYPRDDLKLVWDAEAARRRFVRKSGEPY